MEELQQHQSEKRKGMFTSMAIHVGILLLFLIPIVKFQDPPPGQQGILVSLGYPDQGQGEDRPDTQQDEEVDPTPPTETEVSEEEVEENRARGSRGC